MACCTTGSVNWIGCEVKGRAVLLPTGREGGTLASTCAVRDLRSSDVELLVTAALSDLREGVRSDPDCGEGVAARWRRSTVCDDVCSLGSVRSAVELTAPDGLACAVRAELSSVVEIDARAEAASVSFFDATVGAYLCAISCASFGALSGARIDAVRVSRDMSGRVVSPGRRPPSSTCGACRSTAGGVSEDLPAGSSPVSCGDDGSTTPPAVRCLCQILRNSSVETSSSFNGRYRGNVTPAPDTSSTTTNPLRRAQ